MPNKTVISAARTDDAGKVAAIAEVRHQEALLKAGTLQNAIFNSANFSSIAPDEKGVIQVSLSAPSPCSATQPARC